MYSQSKVPRQNVYASETYTNTGHKQLSIENQCCYKKVSVKISITDNECHLKNEKESSKKNVSDARKTPIESILSETGHKRKMARAFIYKENMAVFHTAYSYVTCTLKNDILTGNKNTQKVTWHMWT